MKLGIISKLKSLHENVVKYQLTLGDNVIDLNNLVGKKISLVHTGNKYCIATKQKVKKTYGQGYSWESFITLPECDQCIVRPELCHFSKGTCRDETWGQSYCLQPHIIYLSLTSNLKVGITRKTQIPTRWIDQGAVKAIKLAEVKDRLTSGLIEVEIAKDVGDKTNWRNMLKNNYEDKDLLAEKKRLLKKHKALLEKHHVEILEDDIYEFNYPVETYPEKVSSKNFDKDETVSGTLMGIKGQYLIFDSGVINMRKFQGYEIELHE